MTRSQLIAAVACTFVIACSSARRFGGNDYQAAVPSFLSSSPTDVSAYFFNFLKSYFPNEKSPGSRLVQTEYLGMDANGGPSAPIRFTVGVKLQDQSSQVHACTVIVHLGNPRTQVSETEYSLYYGEELTNCT